MTDRKQRALDALGRNRRRREAAERELDVARRELARILVRGRNAGLDVTSLAAAGAISRQTAHKLIRETALLATERRS